MQLGRYKITPIECGYLGLDGGSMFGVVPKTLWEKTNPSDESNRIKLAMRAMLIQGDGKNIIIDCGAGHKLSEKFSEIYALDYSSASLKSSLEKSGLEPDEITDVVLTHLHFDHTGGATRNNGSGAIVATFAEATYYVHELQWETALNPSPRDKASYLSENYEVLLSNNQLTFIKTEGELFKDIEGIVVNGHTPGQVLLKIIGGDDVLLYCADLFPTSSHIPLPYIMAYDLTPLETMKEKERVLDQAVRENWIMFYEHDPYRVATRAIKDEKGFRAGEEVTI